MVEFLAAFLPHLALIAPDQFAGCTEPLDPCPSASSSAPAAADTIGTCEGERCSSASAAAHKAKVKPHPKLKNVLVAASVTELVHNLHSGGVF